jgi:peptide/nickel transport system substrate-binding protein
MRRLIVGLITLACVSIPAISDEKPVASGSIVVAFAAEPTTLDAARYSAGVDLYGVSQIYEQLARPDQSGKWLNWLAESWEIKGTADKPVVEVKIRPGIKFHNGDPLTAEDFEYSYQRLRNPKLSRWTHYQEAVERFEVVDSLTFRLHFKEPDSNYVASYLRLWAMPKKYIERVGDDGFAKAPIGTGPWKFKSWKPKDEMVFEAFDDYWNKEFRPTVKTLTMKFIPEDLTRVAAYKTGAVDFIDAVPLSSLEEFRKLPNTKMATLRTGNNLNLAFPTHIPGNPFNDVKVRLAAAHAIDMDAIIKTVLFGQGERYAEVAEGATGYDPSIKPFAYDPKKARQLLTEAGFPRGFDTPCYNLNTPREPNVKEMGEALYAYLSAVGIRCKVVGMEYNAWLVFGRRERQGQPMDGLFLWMFGHGIPGDPSNAWASQLHSYQPGTGWGTASYALIEEAKRMMDPEKRDGLLQQIARLKHDRVHAVTTYLPLSTFAWRADKVEFVPWPAGFWRQMQQLGLKR